MTWNDNWLRDFEYEVGRRVEAAGNYLAATVRENIGVQGTRKTPSNPGEFPRKQSGGLQRSEIAEFDQPTLTSRIGSPSPVSKFLEGGTVKMLPRPHLMRSLKEQVPTIVRIITNK